MYTEEIQTNEERKALYTAFSGNRRIAAGELSGVVQEAKGVLDQDPLATAWIFEDATGKRIEIDFRGTADEALQRLALTTGNVALPVAEAGTGGEAPHGPGRPKLGVVAREVTLLPRHWEWLNQQPGGASVALRKLVDEARKVHRDRDRIRQVQETAYRFLSVMAGNLPGFEEATRALFAGNRERFDAESAAWPADVRDYGLQLADGAWNA
jgi:hypothetical protein